MNKRLRVGLIGAGAIGLVHLSGFSKNVNCELVAIASRTEEHAKAAANRFNIPKIFVGEGWKDMLKNENLDIVSICTPNYLHTPNILEALRNDIHILCEKPICTSREELDIVEKEIKKTNLVFFTAFNKRYLSLFPIVKKIIEQNVLGKIILARYNFAHLGPYTSHQALSKERWFFDSEKAGGGVLLDLGVHSIDLFRYLIDDYEKVEGISANTSCVDMSNEDNCNVLFRFQNNALGIISVSWCNNPSELIEIFGIRGSIKIDLINRKLFSFTPHSLKDNKYILEAKKHKISEQGTHHGLIDHFVNCVLENRNEHPNFDDGKKAVEFVLDSYLLKQKYIG